MTADEILSDLELRFTQAIEILKIEMIGFPPTFTYREERARINGKIGGFNSALDMLRGYPRTERPKNEPRMLDDDPNFLRMITGEQ